jgi:U3 small nucleolar RNA-associated protein 21
MLHLGRIKVAMKGEKQGKLENAVVIAVVLAKSLSDDDEDGVETVGSDEDDDGTFKPRGEYSNESDDEEEFKTENESSGTSKCFGEVVIFIASRSSIHEQNRIPLTTAHDFRPHVAVHPATYVNKIVLGGSHMKTGEPALILLNIRSGKMIHFFTCLPDQKSKVTSLEQSPAVDTIAVGTSAGFVHLINLRSDQLLFTLAHKGRDKEAQTVVITSLSFRTDGTAMRFGIAPLAVGRSDGSISIWDLTPPENDKAHGSITMGRTLLCEMNQVHPGGVSKVAFLPQEPLLLSIGTRSNSILMHIFDNPDHSARILRQRKGHTAPPKRIRYLHPGAGTGGGILVNAADGTDASACQILSSGGSDRTLRIFSSARSVLDKEFSQGHGLEKAAKKIGLDSTTELLLPPLIAMATCETRSRDWGDLVTIHRDHALVYVWSTRRGAQSGPILRQPHWNVSAMKSQPPVSAHATSVVISTCGNYALVGTRGGIIYKYNVQSGIARGCYPPAAHNDDEGKKKTLLPGNVERTMKTLEKKMKVSNRAADMDKRERDAQHQAVADQRVRARLNLGSHAGSAVTGLAVDSVNKVLISVGADAKLILWNFALHTPHKKSPFLLPSPASQLCHVRDSDLAAITLDDCTALLFDCTSQSIVRRFGSAASGPITDLGFSPDGRSLFISSLDSTVRVWDVPTNTCVDWMKFDSSVTSLALSPTGEFLATTHAGKLGIHLWSDKSFYQTTHVDGVSPSEPTLMDDPIPIAETSSSFENDRNDANHDFSNAKIPPTRQEDAEEGNEVPARAKERGLITMSGFPAAHWKNLFHLEIVKERNKPKEPPKRPPTAPFFLQWQSGESVLGDVASQDLTERPDVTSTQFQPHLTETSATREEEEEEWNAVWSDDDDVNIGNKLAKPEVETAVNVAATIPSARTIAAEADKRRLSIDDRNASLKKRKVKHYRSHLVALLKECHGNKSHFNSQTQFQAVTDHLATMGPSAIDVSLLTLCHGFHDLEEGLPLLNMAALWLCESCQTRERFEAVNAYLHRFLHLHARVIAGMEENLTAPNEVMEDAQKREQRRQLLDSISRLRQVQRAASDTLRTKMQQTLCLLRHFARMV